MTLTRTLVVAALFAASLPAQADQAARADAVTRPAINTNTVNREQARTANEQAAEQAIEAVLEANRLDLDIKLIGPTSKKIARDR